MKIYSDYPELRNRPFNTVNECEAEEAKIDEMRKRRAESYSQREEERRCDFQKIKEAAEALTKAQTELDEAMEKAEVIQKEAVKQMKQITDPAKEKLREARKIWEQAQSEYNRKYRNPRFIRPCERRDAEEAFENILRIIFENERR